MRQVIIGPGDRAWHDRFFRHLASVFGITGFAAWAGLGGWTDDYAVHAAVEDGEILSTVGVSRMNLCRDGVAFAALQLGAVATRADRRRAGLSRGLIAGVLAEADRDGLPVFLFANEDVLEFYPRFGFARASQSRFVAAGVIEPAPGEWRPLRLADEGDRRRLRALCETASPHGRESLTAHGYASVLLWHLVNRPLRAAWLGEALAVWAERPEGLVLHEWLCQERGPAREQVRPLLSKPALSVEFGFDPRGAWDAPLAVGPDPDNLLFARHLPAAGTAFRIPDLAQT